MKNKLKKLIPALVLLIATVLVTSCETQEEVIVKSNNKAEFKTYSITLEDLNLDVNAKHSLEKIKQQQKSNQLNQNSTNRLLYNPDYDFFIDTDIIKVVEAGEYKSYTFPIYKNGSDGYLENLTICEKNGINIKEYVVKYQATQQQKNDLLNGEFVDLNDGVEVNELDKMTLHLADGSCWQSIEGYSQATGWGTIIGYAQVPCNQEWSCDSCGGYPSGPTNYYEWNSGSQQYGGTGTPNNTNSNVVVTIPTISLDQANATHFLHSLRAPQLAVLNGIVQTWNNPGATNNPSIKANVLAYLSQNDYSQESQDFVVDMINLVILNGGTFIIDNNVNPNNSIHLNSVDELQDYLDDFSIVVNDDLSSETMSPDTKIARFKKRVNLLTLFNVDVIQNLNPYSISSVSSNISGLTIGMDYEQITPSDTTFSVTTGNIVTTQITSTLSLSLFVQGIGTVYTYHLIITVKTDKTTGEPISINIDGL